MSTSSQLLLRLIITITNYPVIVLRYSDSCIAMMRTSLVFLLVNHNNLPEYGFCFLTIHTAVL